MFHYKLIFRLGELDDSALLYHMLYTLALHQRTTDCPFELVVDLTHVNASNRFKVGLYWKEYDVSD